MAIGYYAKRFIDAYSYDYMKEFITLPIVVDGNRVIINPNGEGTNTYIPQAIIDNAVEFENIIFSFQEAVTDPLVTKNFSFKEKRRTLEYYLESQMFSASNSDFDDIGRFFKKRISFLYDRTFEEFSCDSPVEIGQLDDGKSIYVSREYGGEMYYYETPYLMQFWIGNDENMVKLPRVRYAIETDDNGKRIVHIYAAHGHKKNNGKTEYEKKVDETLWGISFRSNNNIDVYRPALFVLSLFMGMLRAEGIVDVMVPDMIYPRWIGHEAAGKLTPKKNVEIQHNLTNRFLTTFLNLEEQFCVPGVEPNEQPFVITSFPNDIDSYMHISLRGELMASEPHLEKAYSIGCNASQKVKNGKIKEKVL